MGTPLPPNENGQPCINCWGLGKDFGDFNTPLVLPVTFCDLQPGEFWIPEDEALLLQTHYAIQQFQPCLWTVVFGGYSINIAFSAFESQLLFVNISTGKPVFVSTFFGICNRRHDNFSQLPAGCQACGGIGIIDIPQEPY